jgi:hypothetical protein
VRTRRSASYRSVQRERLIGLCKAVCPACPRGVPGEPGTAVNDPHHSAQSALKDGSRRTDQPRGDGLVMSRSTPLGVQLACNYDRSDGANHGHWRPSIHAWTPTLSVPRTDLPNWLREFDSRDPLHTAKAQLRGTKPLRTGPFVCPRRAHSIWAPSGKSVTSPALVSPCSPRRSCPRPGPDRPGRGSLRRPFTSSVFMAPAPVPSFQQHERPRRKWRGRFRAFGPSCSPTGGPAGARHPALRRRHAAAFRRRGS